MKNRILLLSILIVGLSILTSAQSMLIVNLVYDNSGLTPIKNTQVLLKLNGSTIATALTDTTGYCSFNNLLPGTYQCIPVCTIPWGGCNASDCLAIMMNFINSTGGFLTGLKLSAAEVNGFGTKPNALDALLVCKRFVGMISTFWPSICRTRPTRMEI